MNDFRLGPELWFDCEAKCAADAVEGVAWHVVMRPGKRAAQDKSGKLGQRIDALERRKASIRSKAEHPFRVIKRQFCHV